MVKGKINVVGNNMSHPIVDGLIQPKFFFHSFVSRQIYNYYIFNKTKKVQNVVECLFCTFKTFY